MLYTQPVRDNDRLFIGARFGLHEMINNAALPFDLTLKYHLDLKNKDGLGGWGVNFGTQLGLTYATDATSYWPFGLSIERGPGVDIYGNVTDLFGAPSCVLSLGIKNPYSCTINPGVAIPGELGGSFHALPIDQNYYLYSVVNLALSGEEKERIGDLAAKTLELWRKKGVLIGFADSDLISEDTEELGFLNDVDYLLDYIPTTGSAFFGTEKFQYVLIKNTRSEENKPLGGAGAELTDYGLTAIASVTYNDSTGVLTFNEKFMNELIAEKGNGTRSAELRAILDGRSARLAKAELWPIAAVLERDDIKAALAKLNSAESQALVEIITKFQARGGIISIKPHEFINILQDNNILISFTDAINEALQVRDENSKPRNLQFMEFQIESPLTPPVKQSKEVTP